MINILKLVDNIFNIVVRQYDISNFIISNQDIVFTLKFWLYSIIFLLLGTNFLLLFI